MWSGEGLQKGFFPGYSREGEESREGKLADGLSLIPSQGWLGTNC